MHNSFINISNKATIKQNYKTKNSTGEELLLSHLRSRPYLTFNMIYVCVDESPFWPFLGLVFTYKFSFLVDYE